MIDPTNITNYSLTYHQLEEHMLFWICAAGKNGVTAARCLDKLLVMLKGNLFETRVAKYAHEVRDMGPFDLIRFTSETDLKRLMGFAGIGCYTRKAFTFKSLAYVSPNLRTCTTDDLEIIKGIGPKTSRCFLIHSRPNQRLAGLDVHILNFLRDKGYNVPKSTPTGKKYKQIEQWFLTEADKSGKTVADFDLSVWNQYRNKK